MNKGKKEKKKEKKKDKKSWIAQVLPPVCRACLRQTGRIWRAVRDGRFAAPSNTTDLYFPMGSIISLAVLRLYLKHVQSVCLRWANYVDRWRLYCYDIKECS